MMKFDPEKHHRRSIRLKGYDYSQPGAYFVTICTKERECIFGNVINGKMILNDVGKMVEKWYLELMNKFPDIQCDQYIIMPNHIHFIIINVGADLRVCHNITDVRADLCVCPQNKGEHTGSPLRPLDGNDKMGEHTGSPLQDIIRWFKTMTTNEYICNVKNNGWKPFDGKLWQRNYYERIIRNEQELNKIREYIINNPLKWELDKYYSEK